MRIKHSTIILLILLITSSCIKNDKTIKEQKPNVIFILADDLGAGDLQITGHPYVKTPNIDKLASQGIRFERAYMAAAWCAPSRYALMRGLYPDRYFGKTHNLNSKEPSITSLVKNAGYKVAHFGKWHMNTGNEYAKSLNDFGIDEHFTYRNGGLGKTWTEEQTKDEHLREKSTDYFVDMAIDFIETNKLSDSPSPFYMNLWVYPTHSYINSTPEQLAVYEGLKVNLNDFSQQQQEFLKFVAQYGDINQAMQSYCADITAMDNALGRLFDYLRKSGFDKNTIIVFSSDNGPGPLTHQIEDLSIVKRYKKMPTLLNSVGSAKAYRDRKLSIHEGGIRVPFIVSWPGVTSQGVIDDQTVIHGVDWLPTIASICKVNLPNEKFDGIDLSKSFKGGSIERQNPVYWKNGKSSAALYHKWKGIIDKYGFHLYNIIKDPSETQDVKDRHPEIALKLEKDLNNWQKELVN